MYSEKYLMDVLGVENPVHIAGIVRDNGIVYFRSKSYLRKYTTFKCKSTEVELEYLTKLGVDIIYEHYYKI